jgi:two-component system cell cycle sensor histidine kinase/response regulator CckA
MTGLELAKRLRSIRPDIDIILCTGFSDNLGSIGMEGAGISDIVMKPLLAGELTQAIEKALTPGNLA